ncbi:MAG: thioredoxin-dependent thiol peroxidase [Caldisericaceae bacterium]
MIDEGSKAVPFELTDAYSKKVKMEDFVGKFVVLYFYPKALTSGCTKEAQDFRDNYKAFTKLGAEVIGISGDKQETLKKFIDKEKLPFLLLSDLDFSVCKEYNVYKEKSMYGRKYMGIERSTFLIDKKGIVRHIWRKVKVAGHIQEVLKQLETIAGKV